MLVAFGRAQVGRPPSPISPPHFSIPAGGRREDGGCCEGGGKGGGSQGGGGQGGGEGGGGEGRGGGGEGASITASVHYR